ncbi:hypothetical protein D9M69_457000 [compost metagenome]
MGRVLDHDGIGQPALLHPAAQHQADAARLGQDRDQRHLGVAGGQLGQVQRQPGAHHDGIGAAFARLAHQRGVRAYRLHHVDGDQPAAFRQRARGADLAVECLQVGGFDARLVAPATGARHQVGVVVAQVDAGDGAHAVFACHCAGKPVRRDADAHAALHDGQQAAAGQLQPVFVHKRNLRKVNRVWPAAGLARG